jgi:cytochrome c oxidase cbb3-type subunit 3
MKSENKEETKLHIEADEKDILLDHNYDGIQELNHPLPSWWNFIFWAAIVYSVIYFAYYQFFNGPSLRESFNKEYAVIQTNQLEFKKSNQGFKPELYTAIANPEGVNKGKEVYEVNCMPCHSENGRGDIGPNLTDKHWLIAKSTPETIHKVVFAGSEENGMPAWGELITSEEIYFAVAYVSSLKNSFQKQGKAPQGNVIED